MFLGTFIIPRKREETQVIKVSELGTLGFVGDHKSFKVFLRLLAFIVMQDEKIEVLEEQLERTA